jgi:hypothetical protein
MKKLPILFLTTILLSSIFLVPVKAVTQDFTVRVFLFNPRRQVEGKEIASYSSSVTWTSPYTYSIALNTYKQAQYNMVERKYRLTPETGGYYEMSVTVPSGNNRGIDSFVPNNGPWQLRVQVEFDTLPSPAAESTWTIHLYPPA